MKISRGIKVSNTNGNKEYSSFVRIYNKSNILVSSLSINKRNPLGYLQSVSSSKYLVQLHDDLVLAMQDDLITIEDSRAIVGDLKLNLSF